MPTQPPAKFFVNQGVVTSREDMLNLLRPLLKQTVSYRYQRGREVVSHGTGWVERIVVDQPEVSTYFTPIAITVNVDSFEHLDFNTKDPLLSQVRANGQEALAFYSWDPEEEAYVPFALNVLTFRGELISDVTAFIIRTPPETDDREVILRMPEQPASALSLEAAFQNFGLPDRLD